MTEKICTLLLLKRGDQLLLAMKKRGFGAGRYSGVGGKLEPNETIEQALLRETREEIGVVPMNYWKVAEHDFVQSDGKDPWHMYLHTYFCDEWQGEPIETEEMAPQWFDITDIPYSDMWQDAEFWLPQVLADQKIVGTFTYDEQDTLLTHSVIVVDQLPTEQAEE